MSINKKRLPKEGQDRIPLQPVATTPIDREISRYTGFKKLMKVFPNHIWYLFGCFDIKSVKLIYEALEGNPYITALVFSCIYMDERPNGLCHIAIPVVTPPTVLMYSWRKRYEKAVVNTFNKMTLAIHIPSGKRKYIDTHTLIGRVLKIKICFDPHGLTRGSLQSLHGFLQSHIDRYEAGDDNYFYRRPPLQPAIVQYWDGGFKMGCGDGAMYVRQVGITSSTYIKWTDFGFK